MTDRSDHERNLRNLKDHLQHCADTNTNAVIRPKEAREGAEAIRILESERNADAETRGEDLEDLAHASRQVLDAVKWLPKAP